MLGVKVGRSDRFMLLPPDWEEVKLSLVGVNSLDVWVVSLTWVGGGEGGGGGLGVQAWTVTSGDLWPSEMKALSSSLRPNSSSDEWLAG